MFVVLRLRRMVGVWVFDCGWFGMLFVGFNSVVFLSFVYMCSVWVVVLRLTC